MKKYFKSISSRIRPRANNQKPYIFPTTLGVSYGVLILLIVVISLNNKNNLIFLFSFFLFSIGVTVTLLTNKNLEKIEVKFIKNDLFFQSEPGALFFEIKNLARFDIFNLLIKTSLSQYRRTLPPVLIPQVKSNKQQNVLIECIFNKAGLTPLPELTLESTFPFHFLRVWKYILVNHSFWVFPEKRNILNLTLEELLHNKPKPQLTRKNQIHFIQAEKEFSHFQKINENTEDLKDINWKIYAKTNEFYTNKFTTQSDEQVSFELNWHLTEPLPTLDQKKSQMTFLAVWLFELQKPFTIHFPKRIFTVEKNNRIELFKALVYLTAGPEL